MSRLCGRVSVGLGTLGRTCASVRTLPKTSLLALTGSHNISRHYRFLHIDQTYLASTSSFSPPPHLANSDNSSFSEVQYEKIAEETLESLTSYFDEILEKSPLEDADVMYGSGVLTVKLGKYGIYVINKQTPNKQIWLSSPTSGPKRYDFINGTWIYKHNGRSMYALLNSEIPNLVKVPDIDFMRCSYGKPKS